MEQSVELIEYDAVFAESDVVQGELFGPFVLRSADFQVFAGPAREEKGADDELSRCASQFSCVIFCDEGDDA